MKDKLAHLSRQEAWAYLNKNMKDVAEFILELKNHGITIERPRVYETHRPTT